MPTENSQPAPAQEYPDGSYAWYMLGVLVVVYVLNFVDRQLLAILAPDLKRDLGISDSDFGFLYGTAFGVFYALFGIPLGKLADRWLRVRLLTLGLGLWSLMTALSGLSRNFTQLALARVGVGIGEATLSPCAYSLIGDYFPPQRRATALGIYSTGLYIGSGVALYVGGTIVGEWNAAFPKGTAPLGLAGWQAALLMVGLPGLLVALWVATLREPLRGRLDSDPASLEADGSPWPEFFRDLADIVPPFTLLGAARRGSSAFVAHLGVFAFAAFAVWSAVALLGDPAQWIAFGVGCYAVASWLSALRFRDPAAFSALFRSAPFVGVTIGYALVSFVGYANIGFAPLYAIQELHAAPQDAAFMLGGIGALGGAAGVVLGGLAADRIARGGRHSRRVGLVIFTATGTMLLHAAMYSAPSLPVYYVTAMAMVLCMSATLGGASGTIVNIVPPTLRGTAAAAFLLGTNLIGLALGPYAAGRLSAAFGDLGLGLTALTAAWPLTLIALVAAFRGLPRSAASPAISAPWSKRRR
ncbi:MAG TPA: MFS transporter [Novosphingobium sp.]